tara:strand:+ start:270 stop:539 length:270 start_codon:yes stop_codon:yes gene_type:complete
MTKTDNADLIARGLLISVLNDDKKLALKFIDAAANSEPYAILSGLANTLYNFKLELVELDPEIGTMIDNICQTTIHEACDCNVCRGKHQ